MANITTNQVSSPEIKQFTGADFGKKIKDYHKNPDNLVFAYLYLTHKMKFHGINRYEWEVISEINHRLACLGLTKVGVLQRIDQINDEYLDYQKKSTGEPTPAAVIAQRTLKLGRNDYLDIMSHLSTSKSYRVRVYINPNSKLLSEKMSIIEKARLLQDEISSLLQALIENGTDFAHSNTNSTFVFSKQQVTPWDIQDYFRSFGIIDKTSEHDAQNQEQEEQDCETDDEDTFVDGIDFGIVAQYVEIHPEHIPSNLLIALFFMLNYFEQVINLYPENKEKSLDPMASLIDENKNQNILHILAKNMYALIKSGGTKEKEPKDVSPRLNLTEKELETYLEKYAKDDSIDINKPSLDKEGLLGLVNVDEGGFLVFKHRPIF